MSNPGAKTAWTSAVIIFLLTTIAMADRFAISMLIGPIKADFGIGDFQASLLVGAAFALFYTLFLMPIGWAADRYSRRRVLLICLIIWSLASIASGFAAGFVSLFICRMLVGAGEAGLAPCCHGIIGASFPRDRLTRPLALQGIGVQVGGAVGVFAAGAILAGAAAGRFSGIPLLGELEGWRLAFILIGLPGLLAVLLIPLLHDPSEHVGTGASRKSEPFLPFIRSNARLVLGIIAMAGVSSAGVGVVTAWAPEYLQRAFGLPPAIAGAKLGGVLLFSAVLSQAIFSMIVDRFAGKGMLDAPIRLGLLPAVLFVPAVFFTYSHAGEATFFTWQFALLCCSVPMIAMSNSCVQQVAPAALRSRMASLQIFVITIAGFAVGPALVGWLSEYVFGESRLGTALTVVLMASGTLTVVLMLLLMAPLRHYIGARDRHRHA